MKKLNKITVLPGDGIGPEVTMQAVKVINAIKDKYDHKIKITEALMGATAIDQTGSPLPQETLDAALDADAVFLGAIGSPKYADPTLKVRPEQGLLKLRKELGLYANIRPVKAYDELLSYCAIKNAKGSDLVIYRELTGGIYFGESGTKGEEAYDIMSYSRDEIYRMAEMAFLAATKRRNKLCLVDKANVLESSRHWRQVCGEVAKNFPEVDYDQMYVDNAAMQIILNPAQFDVVLTANLFGDILSDEASVITGSLGMLPSASVGREHCLFEPIHGSYPQAAGMDIANPMASILSVAMLFDHFDMREEAQDIHNAIDFCLAHDLVTSDITTHQGYLCSEVGTIIESHIAGEEINLRRLKVGRYCII